MIRVHLVDGTYELYRAHFGAPGAEVSGKEVGATRGMVLTWEDRVLPARAGPDRRLVGEDSGDL